MDMNLDAVASMLDERADLATTGAGKANVRRAQHAAAAIEGWINASHGSANLWEPVEDNLADVLTDLMHLALAADIDFDNVLGRAYRRHIEERDAELTAV